MIQALWKTFLNPRSWIAQVVMVLFLVAFFLIDALKILHPIKTFLNSDSFSFEIGNFKLSIYLVIKAVVFIIFLLWITRVFLNIIERRVRRIKSINFSNQTLMIKLLQIVAYFFVFIITLNILGLNLTTLAVFSGALGIGIGFGLQKIASNFISGLILLFEKSIEHNDLIQLSDGTTGSVRYTGARYTLIEGFDGKEIMVPNEDFIVNRVTNWTYSNKKARIDVAVGVSYTSDLEKVMTLIIEAAKEHPLCLLAPEPSCFLREFASSSVNFLLFFWVNDMTKGLYSPQSDVMISIWKKFKENNISIPFQQYDIHIKK